MATVDGLKPWECDRFTLPEIEFTLTSTKGRCPDGRRSMSDAEIVAHFDRRAKLTPREILQEARSPCP